MFESSQKFPLMVDLCLLQIAMNIWMSVIRNGNNIHPILSKVDEPMYREGGGQNPLVIKKFIL